MKNKTDKAMADETCIRTSEEDVMKTEDGSDVVGLPTKAGSLPFQSKLDPSAFFDVESRNHDYILGVAIALAEFVPVCAEGSRTAKFNEYEQAVSQPKVWLGRIAGRLAEFDRRYTSGEIEDGRAKYFAVLWSLWMDQVCRLHSPSFRNGNLSPWGRGDAAIGYAAGVKFAERLCFEGTLNGDMAL